MTFIGRYYHALEQKGRLSIPSAFRTKLGESAIVTTGLDGCLFLLDETEWQHLVESAGHDPVTRKNARDWSRYLANNAVEVTFDRQGRILVPEQLRELAKLTKDVVVVGSLTRIEIWDRDTYHRYVSDLNRNAETIAESLTYA